MGYDGPVVGMIPDRSGRLLSALHELRVDEDFDLSVTTTSTPLGLDFNWLPPLDPATRDYGVRLVWKTDPIVQLGWETTVFGNPGWDAVSGAPYVGPIGWQYVGFGGSKRDPDSEPVAEDAEPGEVDGFSAEDFLGGWVRMTHVQRKAMAAIARRRIVRDDLGPRARLILVESYASDTYPARSSQQWDILIRVPNDDEDPGVSITLEWRDGRFYDVSPPDS